MITIIAGGKKNNGWVQLMDRDLHMQMEVGAVLIGLVFVFVGMVLRRKK